MNRAFPVRMDRAACQTFHEQGPSGYFNGFACGRRTFDPLGVPNWRVSGRQGRGNRSRLRLPRGDAGDASSERAPTCARADGAPAV